MQIRVATSGDASLIASVLDEAFTEYKASYTPEAFAATAITSEQALSRMSEGPVWVALHNDAIVGTASAVSRGKALYIRGMAILPTARGQGIGEALLEHIESFAREQGCERLFLSTTPFLTRAIRLYEHFGFRRGDGGSQDLFGTPLFTMVKILSEVD